MTTTQINLITAQKPDQSIDYYINFCEREGDGETCECGDYVNCEKCSLYYDLFLA